MRISRRIWMPLAGIIALTGLLWSIAAIPGERSSDLPVLWSAPEFRLVDQRGDSLTKADLAGQPWLAGFVFTHCTDVCPLVTSRMAAVRDSLGATGLLGERVRLVSFSVDPARDTPEVLAEYARQFGGSPPSEWAFATGAEPDSLRRMLQQGFRVTAVALPPDSAEGAAGYQVMHSPRILLIDAEGQVRGHYDARDAGSIELLLSDVRRLLE